jgi:hypothetical protein
MLAYPATRARPSDYLLKDIAGELGTENTFQATDKPFSRRARVEVPDLLYGEGPRRWAARTVGAAGSAAGRTPRTPMKISVFRREMGAQTAESKCGTYAHSLKANRRRTLRGDLPAPRPGHTGPSAECAPATWSYRPARHPRLLFRCRDITGSLKRISPGATVRTNSEALLGAPRNGRPTTPRAFITSISRPTRSPPLSRCATRLARR